MKLKKTLSACLAALFCAALLTPVFAAAPKPRIAVYVTGDKTENEKKTLANEILNTLVKSGHYSPAVRINDFLAALAAEQKKQRVSDAQFRDIAQQHGIDYIGIADITDLFNTSYLSLRIVNAATGESEIISSVYSDLKRFEDFTSVHDKVVGAMFTISQAKKPAPEPEQSPVSEEENASAPASSSGDASYYYKQGHSFSQSNDHDGAIANYTEALRLDPNLVYALIARGAAYYSKGDYQSAVADYSKTIELEPNDAGVFNSRGNAYRKMGNYDMAAADYEAALRIDPNNAEARENLELIKLDKPGASAGDGEKKQSKYMDKSTYKNMYSALRQDGVRFGSTFALLGQGLDVERMSFSGVSVSFGGVMTVPFRQLGPVATEFETEFNYTYRTLSYDGRATVDIKESSVGIPFLFRAKTLQWERYGGYAESGFQVEFPYGTRIVSSGKTTIATDRKNEFQFVFGAGGFFQLNAVTCYLGFRTAPSLGDFAGSVASGLSQNGVALSVLF